MRAARDFSSRLSDSLKMEIFPYAVFYIFFEQYLSVWRTTLINLGIASGTVFVVCLVITCSLWTSSILLLVLAMILVDLMGIMAILNIQLNALSVVNLGLLQQLSPRSILFSTRIVYSKEGFNRTIICLLVLKRESHRKAIVSAVTSGSKRFFLGTDSAPHDKRNKESVCGCAGIYNALVALSVYANVFEEAGALDKLQAFTSFNGPDFYGLPRNTSKIKLKKSEWRVPDSIPYASGHIIPMFAGERLDWLPEGIFFLYK